MDKNFNFDQNLVYDFYTLALDSILVEFDSNNLKFSNTTASYIISKEPLYGLLKSLNSNSDMYSNTIYNALYQFYSSVFIPASEEVKNNIVFNFKKSKFESEPDFSRYEDVIDEEYRDSLLDFRIILTLEVKSDVLIFRGEIQKSTKDGNFDIYSNFFNTKTQISTTFKSALDLILNYFNEVK